MEKDTQATKWLITLNNPDDREISLDSIKEMLQNMPLRYTCICKEIAPSGTPHIHAFLYSKSPMRFSTVKRKFPAAHIDKAQGTALENRDYIRKSGKWTDTEKSETSMPGTFWEWGELPTPAEEKSPDNAVLIAQIKAGYTDVQILGENPKYAFRLKDMNLLRQTLLSDHCKRNCREVMALYLFGADAELMTNYVYSKHGAENICRIIHYKNKNISFDSYTAEDVLLLERFRSDIPLRDMMNYLSSYPIMLPARYVDRVACYTQVYITSDLPPDLQYPMGKYTALRTNEFYNRLDQIIEFTEDGTIIEWNAKNRINTEDSHDL